jgi:hypothetical protein
MKEGQLCRLKKDDLRNVARTHGHLWVSRIDPAPARNWGYFTSVATGRVAYFDISEMEQTDETLVR